MEMERVELVTLYNGWMIVQCRAEGYSLNMGSENDIRQVRTQQTSTENKTM